MSDRRSVSSCIAEIKRINARFRKMKNMDGPKAERLMEMKDRLIDEMQALCPHPSMLATRGTQGKGRRICPRCAFCEPHARALAGKPMTFLPLDEYLIKEGLIVKRAGINL